MDDIDVPEQRGSGGRAGDDELWEKLWQQQILRRAMEMVREQYARKGKLQTFEAFEQNVVKGVSAAETARLLGRKRKDWPLHDACYGIYPLVKTGAAGGGAFPLP